MTDGFDANFLNSELWDCPKGDVDAWNPNLAEVENDEIFHPSRIGEVLTDRQTHTHTDRQTDPQKGSIRECN